MFLRRFFDRHGCAKPETDNGTLAVYRPEEWLERVQPFLEETPVSRTDW